jgi:hypothetical protein
MIIIITIRSAHIGFEDAGIDDDTSAKNMVYESKIVIARPTRKCPTDISKFPFDEQHCFVAFMAWGIPKQFIEFSSLKTQAVIDDFYPHSSWRLLE